MKTKESTGKKHKVNKSHFKIGPTAWGVAYYRTYSDIPYVKEIFEQLAPQTKKYSNFFVKSHSRTPIFEARYKLVDKQIAKNGIRQVLEIASGFSPHGMSMSENGIEYSELDLPYMIVQKRKLVKRIIGKNPKRLRLFSGNAMNLSDLKRAASRFDKKKPIAVINEGLMRYLSFEEKEKLARNVLKLLQTYGGAWITPDITLSVLVRNRRRNAVIKKMSGIDIKKNEFKDLEHAKKFFSGLGFKVEPHSFVEVHSELVSPKNLKLKHEDVIRTLGMAYVFVMRPK